MQNLGITLRGYVWPGVLMALTHKAYHDFPGFLAFPCESITFQNSTVFVFSVKFLRIFLYVSLPFRNCRDFSLNENRRLSKFVVIFEPLAESSSYYRNALCFTHSLNVFISLLFRARRGKTLDLENHGGNKWKNRNTLAYGLSSHLEFIVHSCSVLIST